MAFADNLSDSIRRKARSNAIWSAFTDNEKVERIVFAKAQFPWEGNRIGVSFPPIEVSNRKWLLPYHGKQDDIIWYTQSFMLLQENGTLAMDIESRPSERLLFADQTWELAGEFTIPCLFSCSE